MMKMLAVVAAVAAVVAAVEGNTRAGEKRPAAGALSGMVAAVPAPADEVTDAVAASADRDFDPFATQQ